MKANGNNSPRKVWILTRSHNDYDQHGEYFHAVFDKKPDIQKLAALFKNGEHAYFMDVMAAIEFMEHLLKGGGRQGTEDVWYTLEEVTCL